MEAKKDIHIHTYRPGDPSRVCYFYYKLYEQQYQFNGSVEKYFIKGMGELFDCPGKSQLWVAEQDGAVVGSIAIVKKGDHAAQLRWFSVSMAVQGRGIGNALLETAMAFCRDQNYTDVILWTIDILKPARHLYGKYGFAPTETKPNHEWAGYALMEEKWEYHAPSLTGTKTV